MAIKHGKKYGILAGCFIILIILSLVFVLRDPVLLVTDLPFTALHGVWRARQRQILASLVLFRRVQAVTVADGVGSDVLVLSIEDTSSRPAYVLFPRRYREAAGRYHEQFPHIPVVLLDGRLSRADQAGKNGEILVYNTDREMDFYRAGLCAGIIGGAGEGEIVLFQDPSIMPEDREAFSRGLKEQIPEKTALFLSMNAVMPNTGGLACLVLAGAGGENLEKNLTDPVILFSWLDPALTAQETAVIFDDSPWAMVIPAVKMAAKKQAQGKIPSQALVFSERIADNDIFHKLKKAVGKSL